MKISGINHLTNRNSSIKSCRSLNHFVMDSFISKTSTPSFKSNIGEFSAWAKKNSFEAKDIRQIISNPENKLGEGFSHSVYSIPNCEEYVLRTNKFGFPNPNYEQATIKDLGDNSNLNIGQTVATIDVPCGVFFHSSIDVLKKQKGEPVGVPPAEALSNPMTNEILKGELPYEARERKEYYANSLLKLASLPQSSYETLIDEMIKASEMGYHFDHLNSNNLLLDMENQRINLIDMEKSKRPVDWGDTLYALTNINYFSTYSGKYDPNPMTQEDISSVVQNTLEIIEKFTKAMQNKGVKFNEVGSYSVEFEDFLRSPICSIFCKTGDKEEKLQTFKQMGIF